MTTFAKPISQTRALEKSVAGMSRYDAFVKKMEFNHFAVISLAILVGSCLGGITTMAIFENDAPFWQFALGLGISMANLVACLAQAPTKWVLNLFGASLLINTLLLLMNTI